MICSLKGSRMIDAIGWFSSVILLATILNQVRRQWTERANRSASIWLFAGQTTASVGFTIYSLLLKNWVFSVTNAMLLIAALLGVGITVSQKRRARQTMLGLRDSHATEG